MKPLLRYILFFFIFWLIVFFINRSAFLLSIIPFLNEVSAGQFLFAVMAGWLLDLSTIGYLLVSPLPFIFLYFIFRKKWLAVVNDFLVSFFIILYCLIAVGELCLYHEWTTKLNMQALLHFAHPAEVFQSATLGLTLLFFSLVILFSAFFLNLYNRKFALRKLVPVYQGKSLKIIATGVLSLVLFLGLDLILIRGGLKEIPISESDAYYSQNRMLNEAAVNPLWSLGHNAKEFFSHQKVNPYLAVSDAQADAVMKSLFSVDADSTEKFLSIPKPNIVFIILESYSATVIPTFGGDSFAMFLDSLSGKGMAFKECYASAYVSDQGIPAVLSAMPSSPQMALINETTKSLQMPCISKDLKSIGYQSGFYFGGQLNYGNIKSYLYNMQFDEIRERKNFPDGLSEGKLGIHDKDMGGLFLNELNKSKEPFLKCWFTISSHSPYDIPGKFKPLVEDHQNPYVNTVVYTDEALRQFFAGAKKQKWFGNTLFVIVADHSHDSQRYSDLDVKAFHHIPLLFYGDVIKSEFRGRKYDYTCSQLDIVPTLLRQFNLPTDQYRFGKNMLNPAAKHFAFYYFFFGTGFINDTCFAAFHKDTREILKGNCLDSNSVAQLKLYDQSFLQKVYEDYLSR